MKKKVIGLAAGALAVVVLAVALVFLLKTEPDSSGDVSSAASVTVALVKKSEDDLQDITVSNKKGSFKVEKSGKTFVIKEFKDYERFADNYDQIVMYVTDLAAKQKVDDNPSNLEKYGLKEPQAEVAANYSDGSKFKLNVGNKAPDDESYYVKRDGDSAVYLLSDAKTARFLDDKLDYISPVMTTDDNFKTKTVTNEEGEEQEEQITPEINSFTIIRNDLDSPIKFIPSKSSYSDAQLSALECIYQLSEPFNATLESDNGKEPISLFYAITAESVVDVGINENKYSKYGFKNPTMTLTMNAKEKKYSHQVIVGAPIKDKGGEVLAYYCAIDENDVVYKVAKDDLSWLTLDVNDILAEYIINPVLDEVGSLTVNIGGKDYKFSVTGESASADENSSATGGEDVESASEDTLKVKYNGKSINTTKFRDFYMFLNSLTSTDVISKGKAPSKSPSMTITYKYRSAKRGSDVVKLIPYGHNKVAVSLNGDAHLVARSAYVDRAAENIKKLINNKQINTYW